MLRSSTGRLYALLSACKPNNAKVNKRLSIIEIMEMPEYKALQVYQGATTCMQEYYSPTKLMGASPEQLRQIKAIIPFLEECIRKIYDVICYGDVRKLREFGELSFYDKDSMKKLYELASRLSNKGVNITNIPEIDVWQVFSKETILTLDNDLEKFDVADIYTLEAQIMDKFEDKMYCISAGEIAEKRKEYGDIYRKEETLRLRKQIVENKIFFKKCSFSLISMFMMLGHTATNPAIINDSAGKAVLVIYLLGLIAYWVIG